MSTNTLLSSRLLWELGRGELLVCSGRPLPALLPRLPLPAHHSTLCDVVSRESLWRSAPVRDPPVFPGLRVEEQGRIVEPALGTGLVDLTVVPLPARGQAVESIGGGTRVVRCPPACSRGLQTAFGRVAFAVAPRLGEIGSGPRVQALRQEVKSMLAIGALEIALDPGPGFYSRLFLVEKASGVPSSTCLT